MTDQVLSEENVALIEADARDRVLRPTRGGVLRLIASHRLQTARIQELEERIYFLKLGDKEA